jgi:hypothetical protein
MSTMLSEALFAIWAPPDSRWSDWAKPVLFASIQEPVVSDRSLDIPRAGQFPLPPDTAAIIDLAGSDSVLSGLALAKAGYRPVPLYNSGVAPGMLVNMNAVAIYLELGADVLKTCALGAEAPPVFMLNADRLDNAAGATVPGRYDNRWCIVPQDMPSAEFLKDSGIKQIALLADGVKDDLAHVLYGYQDAGISVMRTVDFGIRPTPINVAKPSFYKSALYRLEVYAGLRRNAAGGFGAAVPDPNASGGGFAG